MRSVSGARNRLALALVGLVALLAAAWLVAAFADLASTHPQTRPYLAPAATRVGELAPGASSWLVPLTAVVSILVALAGLSLLVAQVPRRARTAALRLTGQDGSLLATVDPDVLGRALAERAQDIPGVTSCSVWVAGSSRSVWLQATARLAQEAEVAWAVADLRRRLAQDAATALGHEPQQVDVLIRSARTIRPTGSSASRALTGPASRRQPSGAQVAAASTTAKATT